MAKHVVQAQTRLSWGVLTHGRREIGFGRDGRRVGVAEERDHVIATHEDDIRQVGVARPVGVNNLLDRACQHILHIRADQIIRCISLGPRPLHPFARTDLNDRTVHLGTKRKLV